MVVISLPRARFTNHSKDATSDLLNGIHLELIFASDVNLALDRKFHRIMAEVQRVIFCAEAYLQSMSLTFYRSPPQGWFIILLFCFV